MRRIGRKTLVAIFAGAALVTLPAAAKEFYVGEPIVKNDMQLVPHYLLGIEMAPMSPGMDMGPNAVAREIDQDSGASTGVQGDVFNLEQKWRPFSLTKKQSEAVSAFVHHIAVDWGRIDFLRIGTKLVFLEYNRTSGRPLNIYEDKK